MRWGRVWIFALVTALVSSILIVALPEVSEGAPGWSHEVGLVDPLSGQWHLYDSAGIEETSFYYGNPGDYPFMGDWDGDGVETPGLYRQSDGYVYLRNSNTQGVADIKFFFGNPGDVPVAGDFNGNGFDTVSIYRPSNQTFYIINKLGEHDGGLGAAEVDYVFGNPGDKPFVGDFDGDGVETVGLHRETTGLVYFRNSHTQGNADAQFIFGDPGDRLIAGDWTGDGVFTPALFRPSNTTMYFRDSNTQGNADHQFTAGMSHWMPVSGSVATGGDPGGSPGVNQIDPEKTLLPGADDVVFHTLNNEGQSSLTYTGKVDIGDVIVMGITPETPEGFLGKVTSVSGKEVTTKPASLMDAIPEADFSVTVPLQPAQGYGASGASLGSQGAGEVYAASSLVEFGCGGQAVSVDVNSRFDAGSMVFEAKWGWTGLRRFEAGWRDLSVSGNATLTAAAGIGCSVVRPISQVPLPPVTFTIGFVPVVIVPSVTTDVSLTAATYGGVTVGGDFSAGYGGGLVYEGGNWSSYTDPTLSAHAFSPILNAGGSVTLEVLHGLRGDIYGVGGPAVDVGPFVELAANTSLSPWWTIDVGLSAGMDISTSGWLVDLSYELFRIRLITRRLAQATTRPPPTSWRGCSSQSSIPESECSALVTIYNAMGGAGWSVKTGWLSDPNPCNWYGVRCEAANGLTGHNVTHLFISNVGATGSIPSEIASLTELWLLMVRRNPLVEGPIPQELGNLRDLYILGLDTNSIAGTIPAWLGHMNLEQLWLHGNEFSGAVPVELMNLAHLADMQGLTLHGQSGCLTAANAELSSWLAGYDPRWNDGCR